MYSLLIVDDDEVSVRTLATVPDWEALGIDRVYTGFSAHDAREILQKYPVNVLVSDIEMHGGDGFDVLDYIIGHNLNCRTIFLTNYSYFSYAQKAVNMGASNYLLKPVDFGRLETCVRAALESFKELSSDPGICGELLAEIKSRNKIVQSAVRYIGLNLGRNITRKDVADFLFFNEIYLSKLFKDEVGITLSKYILKVKMLTAGRLLRQGTMSVTEIAESLGYAQASHFSKLFTEFYGRTPSEYRE